MRNMEERVRGHAIAAGLLGEGARLNGYASEAAAWAAEHCARALERGDDLRRVAASLARRLRNLGAAPSELAYVQLVVAEVEALAHRVAIGRSAADVARMVRSCFGWTEKPHASVGLRCEIVPLNVEGLNAHDRGQTIEIYTTAMFRAFRNKSRAYRAWEAWRGSPRSGSAQPWRNHHRRATAWAFAGLEVAERADMAVEFSVDHGANG